MINTLRDNSNKNTNKSIQEKAKGSTGDDEEGKDEAGDGKPPDTIPMPPSFYNDDVERWQKKFKEAHKERDQ